MKGVERSLLRHLSLVVLLKLAVLAALWWVFVRDQRVDVDSDSAGAHLGSAAAAQPLPPPPPGVSQ
jgi:hypothetical protein